MNRKRIMTGILLFLVVLMVIFIFSNSLKSRDESKKDSDLVAGILGPILEWIFSGKIENVGFVVRKLAHFAEFCMLGLSVSGLLAVVDYSRKWWLCGYGLLFCLFIAVCDEFIQSFVGRGSAVSDVLIDFGGAASGFFALIALIEIIKFINNKKQYKKEKCQ